MNLSDYLEKLQNKPRHVRVFILWVSVAISMTIVLALWIWSLEGLSESGPEKISQSENQKTESLTELKKEIPSLWQSLKASVSDILQTIEKESETKDDLSKPEQQNIEPELPSTINQEAIPPTKLP